MSYNYDIKAFNDLPYNNINLNLNKIPYDIIKEKKCIKSNIGNICSYNYKTIYKNELPPIDTPYSNSINNDINDNDNINLRNESKKLSNSNICKQSNHYNKNNENIFISVLENINNPLKPINYNYINDSFIIKGQFIDKKNCNTKPLNYNNGEWVTQHENNINNSTNNKLFNINTKRKNIS